MLCSLALLSSVGEGALSEWAGIYLHQDLKTNFAVANSGALASALGMTVSRFVGTQAAERYGIKALLIGGGLVAASANTLGLVQNDAWAYLASVGIVGAGLANMTPLTMAVLSRFPQHEQAAAVTKVSIAQQIGFASGPPLIGATAGLLSLRYALGVLTLSSLAIGLLAMPLNIPARQPAV